MEPKRPERVLLVIGLLVGLLSAGYVIGYFALPTKSGDLLGIRMRQFEHRWPTTIYWPVSRIESRIIGRRVWLTYPTGLMNELRAVE
jgi:hypothetical protein